jgi:hypothetical protein
VLLTLLLVAGLGMRPLWPQSKYGPGVWWHIPEIPASREVEIWRIMIQGWPRKKVSETPIWTNNLGIVVYICNPSYWEAYIGGLQSKTGSLAKTWDFIWKITKIKKVWGCGSSDRAFDTGFQWVTPIILATWEAEIGRITVQVQSGQKSLHLN